jgi:CBS domain-containing protein
MKITASCSSVKGLPIRIRRTVTPHGMEQVETHVPCPNRPHGASLEECIGCPQYVDLRYDEHGQLDRLVCWGADQGIAPSHSDGESLEEADVPAPSRLTTVSDIMTRVVRCVSMETPLETLRDLLREEGIGGAPVVDDFGHPIGIITRTDLIEAIAAEEEAWRGRREDDSVPMRLAGATVGDVMMPMAFCIGEHAPVQQAAALLAAERIHRLPVVATSGEVVGLVSLTDIARWVAEQNALLT